jgi:ABC-type uncharacterized transport system YnjBCD substrate-binding protein
MKRTLLFLLLSGLLITAQAQKIKFKGLEKVSITDPGQLYSTYKYEDSDLATLRSVLENEAQVSYVAEYSSEVTWPDGLSTLQGRTQLQETIKSFNAYELADLGDKHVLMIPAKKNKKSGVKLTQDIFMIMGTSGIRKINN